MRFLRSRRTNASPIGLSMCYMFKPLGGRERNRKRPPRASSAPSNCASVRLQIPPAACSPAMLRDKRRGR